jgi:hypothetical protein
VILSAFSMPLHGFFFMFFNNNIIIILLMAVQNYDEDEKLGLEDKIERINEVVKLANDFKARGIDVGIDLAKLEEVVHAH